MEADIESISEKIYRETAGFYKIKKAELGEAAKGYAILYGPLRRDPKVVFLGYQPGYGKDDAQLGPKIAEQKQMPEECEYAIESYPLATKMQKIWSRDTLKEYTGLNAIFFRSESAAIWRRIPHSLRKELEDFSEKRAEELVRAIAPERIVTIGFATYDRFRDKTKHEVDLIPGFRRRILRKGEIWGIPAYGMIHLTGARISNEELDRIKCEFENIESLEAPV